MKKIGDILYETNHVLIDKTGKKIEKKNLLVITKPVILNKNVSVAPFHWIVELLFNLPEKHLFPSNNTMVKCPVTTVTN